jgi:DNA-binding NarL/FixJ family response regulator
MEDRTIKILLVDDHTMFRQGLREMLSTDEEMLVVGEAENGSAAVALAAGRARTWSSSTWRCPV